MIKKMIIIVLMVLTVSAVAPGAETKVIPMPDLMNPEALYFDNTRMYMTERTSIYIYSLTDFKLLKKFGKHGEGPKEFMLNDRVGNLFLSVESGDIVVNSFSKVSWFSKEGEYKKEIRLDNPLTFKMQPLGKNAVGIYLVWGQKRWQVLNLYDNKLKVVKEILRVPHSSQGGKGTQLLDASESTIVYGNKLFLAWDKDFIVRVFDAEAKELTPIKLNEKKRKVIEDDKKKILDYLRASPETKDYFEMMKPFHFPAKFPAIQTMFVSGGNLYIVTFKENEAGDDQCIIMDQKGKILKKVFLPLKMSTPLLAYPYAVHEGSLYQVVENEAKQDWTLHITKIF